MNEQTTPKEPERIVSSVEADIEAIKDDIENALTGLAHNAELAAHAAVSIQDYAHAVQDDGPGPGAGREDYADIDLAGQVDVLHDRATAIQDLLIELQGLACELKDKEGQQ